jgi:hypothetical protein
MMEHKPEDCIFCSENETVHHLFFDCIVAKQFSREVSLLFKVDIVHVFESVARFWVANNRHHVLYSVSSCALWCLWKTRKGMIFNGHPWIDVKQVWKLILNSMKN